MEGFCPIRFAVEMGDNVSRRLRLSPADAEMEERSFPNPYPDWDQGSSSGAEQDHSDVLDADGKVGTAGFVCLFVLFLRADG